MNTIDREFLINHGFTEDSENKTLSELFTKRNYSEPPYSKMKSG
ncbi:hypothetical protein C823_006183 [Eubacterium plexicaudatum ASF492]|uniref:Uncharacterized protein n=1 Tax=Eubacterium plexicaudatum ASF492 TaxID=1235802 RepID=N2AQF7_9FIRM|nr:hypothetical protein C823_006183 [Eubacterium plexicaudatum ASF492]